MSDIVTRISWSWGTEPLEPCFCFYMIVQKNILYIINILRKTHSKFDIFIVQMLYVFRSILLFLKLHKVCILISQKSVRCFSGAERLNLFFDKFHFNANLEAFTCILQSNWCAQVILERVSHKNLSFFYVYGRVLRPSKMCTLAWKIARFIKSYFPSFFGPLCAWRLKRNS